MFLKFALSVLLCSIAFASADTYEGYKIYDINAKNVFEKELITRLSENIDYDFFVLPKTLEESARVMIQPKDQDEFETKLKNYGIDFTVVDKNIGQTAELERIKNQYMRTVLDTSNSGVSFSHFQRYDEIVAYLDNLAQTYPQRVTVDTIGQSYEQRDIKAITISNGGGRIDKKVILMDGGIHAREWMAPAGTLYVIYQLVENFVANKDLLEYYNWVIVPVVNPDGYEYTHTKSRMWRKTRKPLSSCYGTDGNRNFDFHWGEIGASSRSCSDTFKGTTPFSEPETQTIRDLMHKLSDRAKLYLSLHAYGNYLLYPWGYTADLPSTWKDIDDVAQAGAAAIRAATGTKYTVGSSTNVLYAAAGGSDDYALAVAKIPISITMELPAGGSGFNPRPDQIKPFVEETWIGIKAMAEKVISKY